MRKLKCSDCGGTLKIAVTSEGMALGTCAYCQAEYLLDRQRKQYVVVEHRFPSQAVRPHTPPPVRRRGLLLGLAAGGAALAVAAGPLLAIFSGSVGGDSSYPDPGASVVFNVGGEGAAPGQFRDYPSNMAIDSLGRTAVMDSGARVYVFGADGAFIANHPKPKDLNMPLALLPGGDLILYNSWPRGFARYSPLSGKILQTVEVQQTGEYEMDRIQGGVTPDGGFATYETLREDDDVRPSLPLRDAVVFYGKDMREKRRLTELMSQAVAADPMVQERPAVTSIAVNGAGSIFINLKAGEDADSRGGVYEFNSDGVFQRRIAVEQGSWGKLAASPDGSIWYGDAWIRDLQRINGSEVQRISLSALGAKNGQGIGNTAAIAAYPNGDLGMATMDHQLVRISIDKD